VVELVPFPAQEHVQAPVAPARPLGGEVPEPGAHVVYDLRSSRVVPQTIKALTPVVERLPHELIDGFLREGRADLITQLTTIFPVQAIAHIIGIPREDSARFMRWSLDLIGFARDRDKGMAASRTLYDYFLPVVRARRTDPRDDVITARTPSESRWATRTASPNRQASS